ncbi:MAG: hypothetical protein ACYCOR_10730 [Acidobacteriaceae bacterium]
MQTQIGAYTLTVAREDYLGLRWVATVESPGGIVARFSTTREGAQMLAEKVIGQQSASGKGAVP